MTPDPEDVMESVKQSYELECELKTDDTVDSVDVPVEFIVKDVDPVTAKDIAKFVSVRGYQAYLGKIKDSQTGNIPVAKTKNT